MLCAVVGISGIGGMSTTYLEQHPIILGVVIAVTLPVAACKIYSDFNRAREESLRRTKDPVYREKLQSLGFVKKK